MTKRPKAVWFGNSDPGSTLGFEKQVAIEWLCSFSIEISARHSWTLQFMSGLNWQKMSFRISLRAARRLWRHCLLCHCSWQLDGNACHPTVLSPTEHHHLSARSLIECVPTDPACSKSQGSLFKKMEGRSSLMRLFHLNVSLSPAQPLLASFVKTRRERERESKKSGWMWVEGISGFVFGGWNNSSSRLCLASLALDMGNWGGNCDLRGKKCV